MTIYTIISKMFIYTLFLILWIPNSLCFGSELKERQKTIFTLIANEIVRSINDSDDEVDFTETFDEFQLEAFFEKKIDIFIDKKFKEIESVTAGLKNISSITIMVDQELLRDDMKTNLGIISSQYLTLIDGKSSTNQNNLIDWTETDLLLSNDDNLKISSSIKFKDLLSSDLLTKINNIPSTSKQSTSIIDSVSPYLKVRRSYLDQQNISKPASLTWSHIGGNDDTLKSGVGSDQNIFEIQGAITLYPKNMFFNSNGKSDYSFRWDPVLVYEANLASNKEPVNSKIIHRAGLELEFTNVNKYLDGHLFSITLDQLTDRRYELDMYGSTLQYTPTYNLGWLSTGLRQPLEVFNSSFIWQPYTGISYSHISDDAGITKFQNMEDLTLYFARAEAELAFLNEKFKLNTSITFHQELNNTKDGHVLFNISGRYAIVPDDKVSLILEWQRGEDKPDFIKEEKTKLSIGIKL